MFGTWLSAWQEVNRFDRIEYGDENMDSAMREKQSLMAGMKLSGVPDTFRPDHIQAIPPRAEGF